MHTGTVYLYTCMHVYIRHFVCISKTANIHQQYLLNVPKGLKNCNPLMSFTAVVCKMCDGPPCQWHLDLVDTLACNPDAPTGCSLSNESEGNGFRLWPMPFYFKVTSVPFCFLLLLLLHRGAACHGLCFCFCFCCMLRCLVLLFCSLLLHRDTYIYGVFFFCGTLWRVVLWYGLPAFLQPTFLLLTMHRTLSLTIHRTLSLTLHITHYTSHIHTDRHTHVHITYV